MKPKDAKESTTMQFYNTTTRLCSVSLTKKLLLVQKFKHRVWTLLQPKSKNLLLPNNGQGWVLEHP